MRSAEAYKQQLLALLPSGPLWDSFRQPGTTAAELLAALAEEPARIDARVDALLRETDPHTVLELLAEWEAWAGLPDLCSGIGDTVANRRHDLHYRLTNTGGQSRADFIALAQHLGFDDAQITEYTPYSVEESVDAPIYGEEWAHAWTLSAPTPDIEQFTADSSVDESLGEQASTTRLECVINRQKPAHTVALFEYT